MPNFLAAERADHAESSRSRSRQRARTEVNEHRNIWERLNFQKIGSWLKREEEGPSLDKAGKHHSTEEQDKKNNGAERPHSSGEHGSRHGGSGGLLHRRASRKVVPGLPRPLTFKRMNSEKRDKLLEVPVSPEQRRAASADRRESTALVNTLAPPPVSVPSMSAPDLLSPHLSELRPKPEPTIGGEPGSNIPAGSRQVDFHPEEESRDYLPVGGPPLSIADDSYLERISQRSSSDVDDQQLEDELEAKWILNLSMHFRDMSDREKFFITFAEEPNKWRRVTVSCDYRQLEPDSLEHDLKSLHYQRDKSARIYEAIRDSLLDIQFYDTVTNLKLQTTDGRLHVHVTEDVNEIIPYPSLSSVEHLECKRFRESAIDFDSHISGFVYKVSVNSRTYIKKEIPGPDAVEEFLYEINALCSLRDSKSVIKFEGIIVDDKNELIKGLLISYADQGALVDLIYDYKGSEQMEWERRERWARQIVEGLSEIHEAGFVQGDFTLSNIVIDHHDNAKIIDINRRGCPVGWEPPELAKLIESGQRISIYIGVKSDLFQLGMVLWALAEQQDEPERQERPLWRSWSRSNAVPEYYRDIVRACLGTPAERQSAKDILRRFPAQNGLPGASAAADGARQSVSTHRSDKEYIDPTMAVDLDDISKARRHSRPRSSFSNVNMPSTEYLGSSGSSFLPRAANGRARSPAPRRSNSRNRRSGFSPYPGPRSVMSLDDSELENELASLPASRETRWEQVYVDGDTKLVQRGGGDIDVQDFAIQEPKDVCITTPPGELENSFIGSKASDETPLSLSNVAELQPMPPQLPQASSDLGNDMNTTKHVDNRASFTARVHKLADTSSASHTNPVTNPRRPSQMPNPDTLANLEHELALDSSIISSAAPSRVGTGFSETWHRPPMHQDSGFDEPERERISYESERIRHIIDDSSQDIKEEGERLQERMWDGKGSIRIGNGVKGSELVIQPDTLVPVLPFVTPTPSAPTYIPRPVIPEGKASEKPLEEKVSNTTIRPPSLRIPEFHHGIPKAMDIDTTTTPSIAMLATATASSTHPSVASDVPRHHTTKTHAASSHEHNIDARTRQYTPPKV
jgi:serine/threonine protein kinase